jgi:hypothetical protein
MTDQKPAAAATPAPAEKPAKLKQSTGNFSTSLSGPNGSVISFRAVAKKDGSFSTYAVMSDGSKNAEGKRTSTRGATQVHPNLEAAKKAVDAMIAEATKLGWVKRGAGRGVRQVPDSFDIAHLPAPPKAA